MKILDLQIQGFRSLKEVSWKPGDLNLIIGPNGSGKSNLLKALEMLSISAHGGLNDQVLREGGMGSLVWDGQA
ncbi:MAG: AAA family ATPase, partial [Chloroflexota bacterium]